MLAWKPPFRFFYSVNGRPWSEWTRYPNSRHRESNEDEEQWPLGFPVTFKWVQNKNSLKINKIKFLSIYVSAPKRLRGCVVQYFSEWPLNSQSVSCERRSNSSSTLCFHGPKCPGVRPLFPELEFLWSSWRGVTPQPLIITLLPLSTSLLGCFCAS